MGNVRVMISDKKVNNSSTIISATDYFPFGMETRSYSNGVEVKYGFNGMEKDNNLGNDYYDFGSRILNAKIAKWLSIDMRFRETPFLTPYSYVNNDPVRFIDPSGDFLLDVHQRIAKNALKTTGEWGFRINFGSYGEKNSMYDEKAQNDVKNGHFMYGIVGQGTVVSGGVTWPDLHNQESDWAHFDNMNYEQIISNSDDIIMAMSLSVVSFKAGKFNEEALGNGIGQSLHAIQDLYSHSNYVELYIAKYGEVTDLNSIPTLKEATTDPKDSECAAILKTSLKTGKYPGEGEGTHTEMNHDVGAGSTYTNLMGETRGDEVTYASKAAEAIATKASVEFLNAVKTEVEKKE